MRARDYDPTSGRFTATDPIAIPTGMPYVAGYSYAFNNPLMFSDVSGAWPNWDGLYNAAADVVNGAASFVNAMNQNLLATAFFAIGLFLMIDGATKDAAAAVLPRGRAEGRSLSPLRSRGSVPLKPPWEEPSSRSAASSSSMKPWATAASRSWNTEVQAATARQPVRAPVGT